jgi:exopolyphosphatase/guanosine-5'-triphosphate,3'-diphosphate pyrophosphatase
MVVAAIDLGSNTLRLLIAEIKDGKILRVLHEERKITRLAEGLIHTHKLADEAITRTIDALKLFKLKCETYKPEKIKVVATSAVREATNKDFFLLKAKEIGFNVEVIDGSQEGYYTFLGVASVIDLIDKSAVIFDIGGGSTEFIYVEKNNPTYIKSIEIGVVKIANTYNLSSIISNQTKYAMCKFIRNQLTNLNNTKSLDILIGTAGTVTTIAAIKLKMDKYDSTLINNYCLRYEDIERVYNKLASIPASERLKIKGLEEGREDLIIAGILLVLEILNHFSKEFLIVSDYGLREGLAIAACLEN